jgi:hypothetical protein
MVLDDDLPPFSFQVLASLPGLNRVILSFIMTFGRELVVLLTKLSMFGACMEVVWRFEQRTFYIGSWRAKLILALLGMPK